MTPEQFRQHGYAVIDWIAQYWQRAEQFPVLSQSAPGEVRLSLPPHPPQEGEPFAAMMADIDEKIMPGITHWQSPNFFAYFPSNISGPSVLAELLCSGLGVQGMLWSTSPACTEVETHVLDWIVQALGLPDKFKSTGSGGGVLQDYASSSVLCALLAARERATQGETNKHGCDRRLVCYCSAQTHSSVEKAVRIAGIGSQNLRILPLDEHNALRPEELQSRIEQDRAQGLIPFFVCATVGTTSSLAIDPLPQIGAICAAAGVWLHVDAAMAGSAAICPEFRSIHDGLEYADSYCFNPHKWLLVNHGCSCLFVANRHALIGAMSILPEYLKNSATDSGQVIDYRDWQIPLGRPFRALKLWFVLRHYGISGLQAHIRHHVHLAELFAGWIEQSTCFALSVPRSLNLVCFHHVAGDEASERVLQQVNRSGEMFLSHTRLQGRYVLRMCVSQVHTTEAHVRAAFEQLVQAAGMAGAASAE